MNWENLWPVNETSGEKAMKKVVILNGANSPNANTAVIIKAFTDGAISAGHNVKEYRVADMNIHDCIGCMKCQARTKDNPHICVFIDDMEPIYAELLDADVIVFASPMYWWGITGQLKTVIDRMQAIIGHAGIENLRKKSTALLMTFEGGGKQAALNWYEVFEQVVGCRNLGAVISFEKQKIEDAKMLGESIV